MSPRYPRTGDQGRFKANAPRDGQGESDIGSETFRLESAYKKPCMPGSFPGGHSKLADFCK